MFSSLSPIMVLAQNARCAYLTCETLPVQKKLQTSQADARSSEAGHNAQLQEVRTQFEDLQSQPVSILEYPTGITDQLLAHNSGIHTCLLEFSRLVTTYSSWCCTMSTSTFQEGKPA